jgi:hypothetical protein
MSKISEIWDFFINQEIIDVNEGEYFYTKLIDENLQHLFYAGLGENKSILIALETSSQPPLIEEKIDSIKSFRHQRHDGKWFLVIQLVNYELRDVFEKLCDDLIAATIDIKSTEVALSTTINRLKLWINLLNKSNKGFLQDFQIRGLIAELNFIKKIVASNTFKLTQAINSWVGPSNAPQDFIFAKEAYEIKSIDVGKRIISISSLDQLEFNGDLKVVVFELLNCDKNDLYKVNLNIITNEIESLINDSDLLTIFKTKLLEIGYFQHIFYDSKNFQIVESYKFKVDDNFPKLLRSNIPREVVNASYEINVEKIKKEIF